MLFQIEEVGDQHRQRLEQAAGLDIAGDDGEIGVALRQPRVDQADERRLRHHRLQTRQLVRLGAALQHAEQHLLDEGVDAAGAQRRNQLQRVQQHREVDVEAPARQRGAARRTGDADEALDPDLLLLQQRRQPPQRLPLLGALRLEARQLRLGEGLPSGGHVAVAEQFPHQSAARVADEVEPGAVRQPLGQIEGIVDGAGRQRAVLEGVDLVAIALLDVTTPDVLLLAVPEVAEAAFGARRRAVQEDDDGTVGGDVVADWQQREAIAGAAVEARPLDQLALQLFGEFAGRQLGDVVAGGDDAQELQPLDEEVLEAALGRAERQPRRHPEAGVRTAGRSFADDVEPGFGRQVERRVSLQFEQDDLVVGQPVVDEARLRGGARGLQRVTGDHLCLQQPEIGCSDGFEFIGLQRATGNVEGDFVGHGLLLTRYEPLVDA